MSENAHKADVLELTQRADVPASTVPAVQSRIDRVSVVLGALGAYAALDALTVVANIFLV